MKNNSFTPRETELFQAHEIELFHAMEGNWFMDMKHSVVQNVTFYRSSPLFGWLRLSRGCMYKIHHKSFNNGNTATSRSGCAHSKTDY